ncbi:MAG: filamentous hemagglutinin N-terminal domain-containing protein, partial [Limisphaerales bacterium]
MKHFLNKCRSRIGTGVLLLVLGGNVLHANPTGGTVTQGSATFSSSGSQFTINQTSANAFINWQTFNIAGGETTTFNQPSSSSVTWNYINDPNASSINGNLNAIGYVVLQNPNGFSIGGQASITAHGLVMTTAATPALNLSSGGPWSFNTPPPAAKIVNYGQINITGGGSAFLIANDIENNGTISAPGGKVGL